MLFGGACVSRAGASSCYNLTNINVYYLTCLVNFLRGVVVVADAGIIRRQAAGFHMKAHIIMAEELTHR